MHADAIVLDIDGVLVDTAASYRRAIVDTVEAIYGETIAWEDTQLFKDAGGFNNDWRLTEAAALFVLARRAGYHEDISTFTRAIARRGGGIDAARDVLKEAIGSQTFAKVEESWYPERLRRNFQWLYLGPARYGRLEESPPPEDPPSSAGYIEDEPVLIDPDTVTFIDQDFQIGILTGRPRDEARIALERVHLDIPADRLIAMEDWSGGKPDPEGLITLAQRCGATTVLYVGDELDDVRTAVNAAAVDPDRTYCGIGVLSGGLTGAAGERRFDAVGATAVLGSINELPALLASERSPR